MALPVGEDNWLAYLEESVKNATDLEKRVDTVERHEAATKAEPGSLRIWLAKCNYFWSLWATCHSPDCSWPEDELLMGREAFSFGTALDLWQTAYEAIKYRLNDSHLLWDRWISLEMEQFDKTRTNEGIKRLTHLFRDRLVVPHLTWDDTSQRFSSFLNEYNRDAYEEQMKDVTQQAQEAKRLIAARDPFELKLRKAEREGKLDEYKAIMLEYLDWEMLQSKRNNDNPDSALDLCRGLYARALTGVFAADESVWHEYIVYLSSSHSDLHASQNLLSILARAVKHCPWSGTMWNRYILCAEEARLEFSQIADIKHAATSDNQLYKDGMESLIEMYVAWCSFLRRRAIADNADQESIDIADVGLTAALEDVEVVGKRLYGNEFQGDPKFRLEKIYIQYLTEKKNAVDQARQLWKKLAGVQAHADSYDFWFRYYMWEMLVFSSAPPVNRSPTPSPATLSFRVPTLATAVLSRAVNRRTIDWPEKVLEVYRQHCNDYELPASIRQADDSAHKVEKRVRKRREQEEAEKNAAYAAYYGAQQPDSAVDANDSVNGSKRKRDQEAEATEDEASETKRQKNEATAAADAAGAKRDRENTTVLVTNLPLELTQTKLRQYFKEYGHINNITAFVKDEKSKTCTALIEFASVEEAQSALLRDGKYLGETQISVVPGSDLTVYVANFPPSADDSFLRNLFDDCGEILSIRWPSLRVNTRRRFCYISFRDKEASAKAVAKEGTLLEEKFRLLAKYSDPGRRKNREGAVAEGREVHVTNLDRSASEADLRAVFGKYGNVTRVNIPQNLAGKSRGFAFLDYETKEQAQAAANEMNNAKFRSEILTVEVSKDSKVKATARSGNTVRSSASPAPSSARDQEGDEAMGDAASESKPSREEIAGRTIALMGLPDTVNDARVRALVDPLGEVIKMVLQPSHGGAQIEFVNSATAGKAALKLDGMSFEGSQLRTGSVEELRNAKPSTGLSNDLRSSSSKPKSGLMPQPAIRRPTTGKTGPKRGLGFVPRKAAVPAAGANDQAAKAVGTGAASEPNGKTTTPKSNADFKALFLAGKEGSAAKTVQDASEKKIAKKEEAGENGV